MIATLTGLAAGWGCADAAEEAQMKSTGTSGDAHAAHAEKIHWRQWGDGAFEEARREEKLVLLDIGAVWCHWCHVMDRTTYADDRVAELINERLVPVRVDRDQRPDVDRHYQAAPTLVQSHGGGWPLTVWLLPDGTALYRATYLPPDDQGGRPGFLSLAQELMAIYRDRRDEIDEASGRIAALVREASERDIGRQVDAVALDGVAEQMARAFDEQWGGFYGAPGQPKFPSPGALEFLLAHWRRSGNKRSLEMVATTLERMAAGGVHDQLAGGFHRYAVDQQWRVPHFEKLLYDNGEMLVATLQAYQATGAAGLRELAEGTVRFIDEVLTDHERGGFFGSQDADVGLSDDGDFFTWTEDEARAALDDDEFRVFAARFDVGESGEMHHDPARNVLWRAMSLESIAEQTAQPQAEVARLLESAKAKALAARRQRPQPSVDETMYVNWNAMMIRAYVLAAGVLDRPDLLQSARRAADRIVGEALATDGAVSHVIGQTELRGLLDDQAWAALALAELAAATDETRYLDAARSAIYWADANLWDDHGGGYFDRPGGGSALPSGGRDKPMQDSPSTSSNAVAAWALVRLATLTEDESYRQRATETVEAFGGVLERLGVHGGGLALAAEELATGVTRVDVVGSGEAADGLTRAAREAFVPAKLVRRLDPQQAEALGYAADGPAAYVCRGTQCLEPVTDVAALRGALGVE